MASKQTLHLDIDTLHEYGLHVPTRTIYLGRTDYVGDSEDDPGVDYAFAGRFIKNMHILESVNSDPIHIYLSSPGGSEVSGMAIYSAIQSAKSHVTILGVGEIMSMGAVILQAADIRKIDRWAQFMTHEGSSDAPTDHKKNNRRRMDFDDKYSQDIDQILFKRIKEKHADFTKAKFDKLNVFDTYLFADEVVDLGLADEVVNINARIGE